jgi:hypothetical protein
LRARPWNRNYVGVHFGGSLFAMTDPFWMLLTMHALGNDYIVWDQAGAIDFVKPGRGTVHARFQLDDAVLAQLRAATAHGGKHLHWFETRHRRRHRRKPSRACASRCTCGASANRRRETGHAAWPPSRYGGAGPERRGHDIQCTTMALPIEGDIWR